MITDIDADLLRSIVPRLPKATGDTIAAAVSQGARRAHATTVARCAAFISQTAWESGMFTLLVEGADGRMYEGRSDLGNTQPGDGPRYKGRGLIQITGRENYRAAGKALDLPLIEQPELAAEPLNAGLIAAWYWESRGLNDLADRLDFRGITRKINGAATDGAPSYHRRREAICRDALERLAVHGRLF